MGQDLETRKRPAVRFTVSESELFVGRFHREALEENQRTKSEGFHFWWFLLGVFFCVCYQPEFNLEDMLESVLGGESHIQYVFPIM